MPNRSDRRSLFIIISVFLFVVVGTYLVSLFARGYQINFQNGPQLKATGILSVVSVPKGASVYVNDRLLTATDDTLNLLPGDYHLKIVKDGYLPWEKNIKIKQETVYAADVQLFRSVPDLRPVTLSGAINPTLSPDGTKIIYSVASASAEKDNGLYLIDLNTNPFNIIGTSPRQIAPNFPGVSWSEATFSYAPNGTAVLATFKNNINYLLSLSSPVTQKDLTDVTVRLPLIQNDWNAQTTTLLTSRLQHIPSTLRPLIATDSATHAAFNSTDDKILYLADQDGSLPPNLITPPPAQSTQTQSRNIKNGYYYVYDLKDDTNFLIGDARIIHQVNWIPNTTSIVFTENNNIQAIEYDGTNKQTIFTSADQSPLAFPGADGSRIITLTAPYSGASENLYAISLK